MFRRPDLIIVRKKFETQPAEDGYYSEKGASSGYSEYVKVNGLHFNDKLAEYAIAQLKNIGPNETHKWSIAQVTKAVNSLQNNTPFLHKTTYADLAYAANMYYSDFYPQVITSDTACIQAAIVMANDPDGYEGIIFSRWVADTMVKYKSFDWTKFI